MGINRIAQTAGVNKNLIYRYFSSVDNLVETYIREKDFWLADNKDFETGVGQLDSPDQIVEAIVRILQDQLIYFAREEEMQHLILSEISENDDLLKRITHLREEMAGPFFERTDHYLGHTDVNFRGVAALLVSGIYYLVLQSKKNEAINCGINMRKPEGMEVILKSIRQIVEMVFHK